jgi:cytochrome c-type biogenesis protein CcmH
LAWLFWIIAGGLTAAAAALVTVRAVAAAKGAGVGEDPALGVYRRQLAELDDLAARDLLGVEEHRAAFAEAGRRLLAETERAGVPEVGAGRAPPRLILAGIAAAALAALGLYLALGSPGFPDQPYRTRLAQWRSGDPSRLKPAEMAAILRDLAAQRPNDPQAFEYLARTELAAGDPIAAAEAARTAIRLNPARADLHAMLGEALTAAAEDGSVPPQALSEFQRALELDPRNLPARYLLARARIAAGDREGGLAAWQALAAELAPDDPRRKALAADIAQTLGPAVAPAPGAVPEGAEQAAFIRAMVTGLASRLEASPDDPDGWARLVRAYTVLGDQAAKAKALDRARKLFAGRPADLAKVEAGSATIAPPPRGP